MKFKIFGKEIEIRSTKNLPGVQDDAGWMAYLAGKGYYVSAETALKVAAVLRCVDVVAKTMASLPLVLYKNTKEGKVKAIDHPLFKLLNKLPNPETTHYEFWHMYIANLMLARGAYAKIKRDQNGFITEVWNIPTSNVYQVTNRRTGERYLQVYTSETDILERLYPGYYMYTPGFRYRDYDTPEDPIAIARSVLGLTMALNGYAQDFFENGSNIGGFIEYPGAVSDKAYTRFKESWDETYTGVTKQHRIAFLESGFKFNRLESKPNDAQALESRKHQVLEICRIWGIPPHKLFELDRATFNNIEQLNIEFVQECLDPMSVRLEETIFRDLLTTKEQNKYYAKFNTNALLRGDIKSRTEFYNTMRQNGVFSANNILELEDMNFIPNEEGGNLRLVNGNMIPLSAAKNNLPKAMLRGGSLNNGQGNQNAGNGTRTS